MKKVKSKIKLEVNWKRNVYLGVYTFSNSIEKRSITKRTLRPKRTEPKMYNQQCTRGKRQERKERWYFLNKVIFDYLRPDTFYVKMFKRRKQASKQKKTTKFSGGVAPWRCRASCSLHHHHHHQHRHHHHQPCNAKYYSPLCWWWPYRGRRLVQFSSSSSLLFFLPSNERVSIPINFSTIQTHSHKEMQWKEGKKWKERNLDTRQNTTTTMTMCLQDHFSQFTNQKIWK